jgi:hypothetical protein
MQNINDWQIKNRFSAFGVKNYPRKKINTFIPHTIYFP